jgi:hypothetical protein
MYQSGHRQKAGRSNYPLISKKVYIEVVLKAGNTPIKKLLQGEKFKKTTNV